MEFKNLIKKFYTLILDILFPIQCVGCKAKKVYLCNKCLNNIKTINNIIYSTSSLPNLTKGGLCGIIAACDYKSSKTLKESIHLFKYKNIKQIGISLGKLMGKRIQKFINENKKTQWLVIPVPLHKRRELERGFNQNDVLAKSCFKNYKNVEILLGKQNPIIRTKYTKSQTKLTGKERVKNIKKVFKLKNKEIIYNQNIIIIDDIATTGATIKEIAKILKENGSRQIWGFVLAKD